MGLKLNKTSLNCIYLTPLISEILVSILLEDANIRSPFKKGESNV